MLLACIIAVVVFDFGLVLRISLMKYIQYCTWVISYELWPPKAFIPMELTRSKLELESD